MITVEDGVVRGGVGQTIAAFFNAEGMRNTEVISLGIGDAFVEHGTPAQLYSVCGYDADAIFSAIKGDVKGDKR